MHIQAEVVQRGEVCGGGRAAGYSAWGNFSPAGMGPARCTGFNLLNRLGSEARISYGRRWHIVYLSGGLRLGGLTRPTQYGESGGTFQSSGEISSIDLFLPLFLTKSTESKAIPITAILIQRRAMSVLAKTWSRNISMTSKTPAIWSLTLVSFTQFSLLHRYNSHPHSASPAILIDRETIKSTIIFSPLYCQGNAL